MAISDKVSVNLLFPQEILIKNFIKKILLKKLCEAGKYKPKYDA